MKRALAIAAGLLLTGLLLWLVLGGAAAWRRVAFPKPPPDGGPVRVRLVSPPKK